jgi:hypothetical protein
MTRCTSMNELGHEWMMSRGMALEWLERLWTKWMRRDWEGEEGVEIVVRNCGSVVLRKDSAWRQL